MTIKLDIIVMEAIDLASNSTIPLTRDVVGALELRFEKGKSPVGLDLKLDEYRRMSYDESIRNRQILEADGSVRIFYHPEYGYDVKPSFDHASIDRNVLKVHIGLTDYDWFRGDLKIGQDNPKLNLHRQERGIKEFQDRWAYFHQALGTAGLVITKDGSVVLGRRNLHNELYPNYIDSIAGFVLFPENQIADPSSLDPERDVRRLAKKEFGIEEGQIDMVAPVGFYGHPNTGEFDITYLLQTNIPSEYFSSGAWRKNADFKQDRELILLNNFREVQDVLSRKKMKGEKFMYSALGALRSLKPEDLSQ